MITYDSDHKFLFLRIVKIVRVFTADKTDKGYPIDDLIKNLNISYTTLLETLRIFSQENYFQLDGDFLYLQNFHNIHLEMEAYIETIRPSFSSEIHHFQNGILSSIVDETTSLDRYSLSEQIEPNYNDDVNFSQKKIKDLFEFIKRIRLDILKDYLRRDPISVLSKNFENQYQLSGDFVIFKKNF